MKNKFKIAALVISLLFCGIAGAQDEFFALSSAQFLKGLDNQDYLRNILTENGFTLARKWKVTNLRGGIYEYWEHQPLVYVDMIMRRGQKCDIVVRVFDTVKDLPDRLLQTFPYKKERLDDDLSRVNLKQLSKDKQYSLKYEQDGKDVGVFIWYDSPFYYFEYTTAQAPS